VEFRDGSSIAASFARLERAKENEDYAARQFVRAVQQRQQAEAEYERQLARHRDAEAA
jgi:hypothetical protein